MAEEKKNEWLGFFRMITWRTSQLNVWRFMFKYFASLLFLWSSVGFCNWFPGMVVVESSRYLMTFQGGLSGIGYSQEPIDARCEYITYLRNNQPLPDIYYEKENGAACGIFLKGKIVSRETPEGTLWQTQGNCCRVTIELTYKELYENRVLTIGDFTRVAYELGKLQDRFTATMGDYPFSNPNSYCFSWGFSLRLGNTNYWLSDDNACYRGQKVHPSCNINNAITIDHGLVSQEAIKNGGASASVNAFLTCDDEADVILRTNISSDVKLEAKNGTGEVTSKLYLNGQYLLANGGIKMRVPSGNTPLQITSVLSGKGNPEGEFRGSTVLVISMP
ncbi:TPA: hypothetical protein ACXJQO_004525 [Serratia marcescens]